MHNSDITVPELQYQVDSDMNGSSGFLVSLPDFPAKLTDFHAKLPDFPAQLLTFARISKSFADTTLRTPDGGLSYPRNVFYFLSRNGDLAALELRKAAKTCMTFIPQK